MKHSIYKKLIFLTSSLLFFVFSLNSASALCCQIGANNQLLDLMACSSAGGTPVDPTICNPTPAGATPTASEPTKSTGIVTCNISGLLFQMTQSECTAKQGNLVNTPAKVPAYTAPVTAPPKVTTEPNKKSAPTSNVKPSAYFPNLNTNSGIQAYIKAIYIYAIGIVGILSTIVIMIGGLIWISSMGNAARVTSAKDWIGAALTGLALAMFSYMLLWIINPDLVSLKPLDVKDVSEIGKNELLETGCCFKAAGSAGIECTENSTKKDCSGTFNPGRSCGGINACDRKIVQKTGTEVSEDTCEKYGTKDVINFSTTAKEDPNVCDKYDAAFLAAAAKYNINYKLIKAIATQESSCNPSARSEDNACGIMQLLEGTAGVDCDYLMSHPEESIDLGAKYLDDNRQGNDDDWIAGYNGGYGTNPSANGTLGPLATSNDCPGNVPAYRCCKNPDDLAQTQDYVFKVKAYYNGE